MLVPDYNKMFTEDEVWWFSGRVYNSARYLRGMAKEGTALLKQS